jgi:hypothetical protein
MSKFKKIYEAAMSTVTVNPQLMKDQIGSKLGSLPDETKKALAGVAGSLDTKNPVDELLTAVQKDPSIIQKLTPDQKEALNKILNPENTNTTTQQNKGQTNGQRPTLDEVQKQQPPTSNAATRPLV